MSVPLRLLCMLLFLSWAETATAALPSAAEMKKLHPVLQALVREHARGFHGAHFAETSGGSSLAEYAGVLIGTTDPASLRGAGIHVGTVLKKFVTARVRTGDLETLARLPEVRWVDPGSVNFVQTDVSVPETGARLLHAGFVNKTPYMGQGAIILVYDTGIDWSHYDFRVPTDPSRTRILSIWDQTLVPQGSEANPAGFDYGVEYTKAQIEGELALSPAGVVRERDINGHGTHVAGTAAGNGLAMNGQYIGMAPEADIVVVKGGNGSFGEVQMIDGLRYAEGIAARYGRPIVVNWSIGGHYGPHDGTRPYEAAVDNFVSTPGRVVCISAGNDGAGLIHKSGSIPGDGSSTITINVGAYTPAGGAENDEFLMDVWLRSASNLSAAVRSPSGVNFACPADSAGTAPDHSDGTIQLYDYLSSVNGCRTVELYVHDADSARPPKTGTWLLVLTNPSGVTQGYDLWITSRSTSMSSVAVAGADNTMSVSMPGTSRDAVTVASYVTKWSWPSILGQRQYPGQDRTGNISTFSSMGPTADGRAKPDIAAPGQYIAAALSSAADTSNAADFIYAGNKHRILAGTSMASPHVAGAAALLLGTHPSLTAGEIKDLLQSTANADQFASALPNYTWGAGKLDIVEAMAKLQSPGMDIIRTTVGYDTGDTNYIWTCTGSRKAGVRFTAPASGRVAGLLVNVTTSNNRPIQGSGSVVCELFSDNGGTPGTRLGSPVSVPLTLLNPGTLNYVQTWTGGMPVTAAADYFAVLSLSNPADTLKIRTDNSVSGVRSVLWNGSAWSGVANNLRVRMIVASGSGTSSVAAGGSSPGRFALDQNYPNPFNPSTHISYTVPVSGLVRLEVSDMLGRRVATLVDGVQPAGTHGVVWNGRSSSGAPVASGVYFYRLESSGMTLARKMILLH